MPGNKFTQFFYGRCTLVSVRLSVTCRSTAKTVRDRPTITMGSL